MTRRQVPLRPALLITGGFGFIGQALVRELLRDNPVIDASEIRIFDIHSPTIISADPRVRFIKGDIRDYGALAVAMKGVDAVFHLASMVDWGTHKPQTVYEINTDGTAGALKASQEAGVSAFIHTSSLDAVITTKPLRNVDESIPYPARYPNAYCGSKAEAEKLVFAANGQGGMRTVSLRPSSVWGEADPYHISALVNLAKSVPYVRIGDGSAVQQLVYVGNLAHAHLAACREILEAAAEGHESTCSGKPYFITDGPAENFFHFFDRIVEKSGYQIRPANLWIPRRLMLLAGILAESLAWLIRPMVRWNPKVSRFAVNYTCNDFTYTSAAAERDFGFIPVYTIGQAMSRTIDWFRNNETVNPPVITASPEKE